MLLTAIDTIPGSLTFRDHPITLIVGFGMFLSFVFIALAKLVKPDIYSVLMISFVKNKGLYNYIRESFQLHKTGSILLILNYLVSFSLLLILVFDIKTIYFSNQVLMALIMAIVFLLFHFLSLLIISWITGELGVFKTPMLMKINGIQLIGLSCSILVFLWSLNFIDQELFFNIIFSLFVFESITRIVRSFIYVLTVGVSWYYIIMYLCTLEILPLFLVYYIVEIA
jgi:hypothetical protein